MVKLFIGQILSIALITYCYYIFTDFLEFRRYATTCYV